MRLDGAVILRGAAAGGILLLLHLKEIGKCPQAPRVWALLEDLNTLAVDTDRGRVACAVEVPVTAPDQERAVARQLLGVLQRVAHKREMWAAVDAARSKLWTFKTRSSLPDLSMMRTKCALPASMNSCVADAASAKSVQLTAMAVPPAAGEGAGDPNTLCEMRSASSSAAKSPSSPWTPGAEGVRARCKLVDNGIPTAAEKDVPRIPSVRVPRGQRQRCATDPCGRRDPHLLLDWDYPSAM